MTSEDLFTETRGRIAEIEKRIRALRRGAEFKAHGYYAGFTMNNEIIHCIALLVFRAEVSFGAVLNSPLAAEVRTAKGELARLERQAKRLETARAAVLGKLPQELKLSQIEMITENSEYNSINDQFNRALARLDHKRKEADILYINRDSPLVALPWPLRSYKNEFQWPNHNGKRRGPLPNPCPTGFVFWVMDRAIQERNAELVAAKRMEFMIRAVERAGLIELFLKDSAVKFNCKKSEIAINILTLIERAGASVVSTPLAD